MREYRVSCTVKIPDNKADIVCPQLLGMSSSLFSIKSARLIEGIFKIEKATLTDLWEEIPNNFLLDFFRLEITFLVLTGIFRVHS